MLYSPVRSYQTSGNFFPLTLVLFYLKVFFFDISMCVGIWGLGFWAFYRWPIKWDSGLERFVFETALGFGITSFVMFFLGVVGLYRPWAFWLFFVVTGLSGIIPVLLLAGAKSHVADIKNDLRNLFSLAVENPFQSLILLFIVGLGFMMSFVPEIFYDPLVYHLGVPNWYLQAGKIINVPILYSHYTLAWQMVNLYSLGLTGGEAPAKFFHLFSGLLLCLGFFTLMKRWSWGQVGILAAVSFLAMPMVQMAMWTTGNDVSVSLFAFLSIYGFLVWMRRKPEEESTDAWIYLCGIFGGLAFITKYTSAVHLPAVVGALIVYAFLTKQYRLSIKFIFIFSLLVALVFLPWGIKTFIFTGNPFYHFFMGIFGGVGGDPVRLLTIKLGNLGVVPGHWWGYLTLPWVLTMKNNSSLSYPGPFLLAALALFLAIPKDIRKEPWLIALLVYISFEAFILLPVARTLRYHLPQMTGLIVLIGLGWGWFYKRTNSTGRAALVLVTNLCLVAQVVGTWIILQNSYLPWNVLVGAESRQAYREYTHPGLNPYPSDAAFAWLKENFPESKVLIFGDEKNYPCPVKYYASGIFDYNLLAQAGNAARSLEDILKAVQREGITHILVNVGEARRLYAFEGVMDWNPKNLGLVGLFWQRHVRILKNIMVDEVLFPGAKSQLMVYEIIDEKNPRIAEQTPFNPLIYLYEDYFAQRNRWGVRQRLNLMTKLWKRWPEVLAFRYRAAELSQNYNR